MESRRRASRDRGSAMVMAVALLALLAVIGTVYIVAARAQREAARNLSHAVNFDLAEQAVTRQVQNAISASMYDAQGVLGGLYTRGPLGTEAARRWTMPERGCVYGFGKSNQNAWFPDNGWLVENVYRNGYSLDPRYNDYSLLTGCPYNPATGRYDTTHPYYDPVTGLPALPTFRVVADNVNLDDGIVQLLAWSEAGCRYRYGIRVIDTCRMANLSTGEALASTLDDAYGSSPYSMALAHPAAFHPDDRMANLDRIRPRWEPFNPGASPFDLSDELELRAKGSFGTPLVPRVASAYVWPNTLGNVDPPGSANVVGNPRREYYTTHSYTRKLRPYLLGDDMGRGEAYTVTPPSSFANHIWPAFPLMVEANAPIGVTSGAGDSGDANRLAATDTNIATAMEKIAGYSHEETCAFAANYISMRWNSWWSEWIPYTTPNGDGQIDHDGRYLVDGLEFIDEQGMCFSRSRWTTGDRPPPYCVGGPRTTDLHAEAGRIYVGYAAQPFLNEVAVRPHNADVATSQDDFAVEFYNPYRLTLSLNGYRLRLSAAVSLDLGRYFVPARGYLVITRTDKDLVHKVRPDARTVWVENPALDLSHVTMLYLMREYIRRNAPLNFISFAAIDQFDCSNLIDLPLNTDHSTVDHYLRRGNDDPPSEAGNADYLPRWCAAEYDPDKATIAHDDPEKIVPGVEERMTLGGPNPVDDSSKAVALYDRHTSADFSSQFKNINDFNRVMRICHEIDPNTGLPTGKGTISAQLHELVKHPQPEVKDTQFPVEASVYFDFRTPPWAYASSANSGSNESQTQPGPPYPTGDVRAMRLLECLSFWNLNGTNRIAGPVNVNTAPAEILSMIPILNTGPGWVGGILAYRWRCKSDDERIPEHYRTPWYDFSDSLGPNARYPGYGIRSLGELEIPLSYVFSGARSLQEREALWADVFNLCTVRSDTFVLYGYLECVKQNPRYRGGFDNFLVWYQTGPRAVTDDPENATAPLVRVGRRRWVALLDSSRCNACRVLLNGAGMNAEFSLPKIVAVKDMPQ